MYHVIHGLHLCAAMQLESTTRLHKIYLTAPEIGEILGTNNFYPHLTEGCSGKVFPSLCPWNGLFWRSYTFVIL